jgi:hypothetical protein
MKLFLAKNVKMPKGKNAPKVAIFGGYLFPNYCLGLGKVAKIVKFHPIWSPCFLLTNLLLNHKHLKDID